MTDRQIKNARILEAFGMIDEKYIGEVAASLNLDDYSEEPPKASPWKSLRSLLALAACVMLLGALFPVAMQLINNFAVGTTVTDPYSLSQAELDAINEAWGGSGFAETPDEVGYLEGYRFIYGKYDGAIPLGSRSLSSSGYGEESVAGYVFEYTTACIIAVYYDGEIIPLYTAHASGILSDEQIEDIWRKHQNYDEKYRDDYIYGDYLDPIEDLELLTKSGVAEINAAWAALHPDFDGALINTDKLNRGMNYRYLGTIDGKVIIWRSEGEGVAVTKRIGLFEFSHSSSFDIIVCDSDEFYYLDKAYAQIVTDVSLAMIYARNEEYEKYFALHNDLIEEPYLGELKIVEPRETSPFKLTYEEQYEIISSYIKDDDESYLKYSYSVRCYMKADGAYAVMLDSGRWLYTQALRHVDVAGYTFLFPDGQRMYIYKDGKFYTLLEAYQNGVVSRDYIASIIWNKSK